MWKNYFKMIKLVPGRVVVPGHGTIDFSRDDLPVEIIQKLYEEDFPYLELTPEGKKEIYGIKEKTSKSIYQEPLPQSTPAKKRKRKKRSPGKSNLQSR